MQSAGISTVAGNQSVDKTTINAAKVVAASGIHGVRVHEGISKPLTRGHRHDPEIHGECGLGGSVLSSWTLDTVQSLNPDIMSSDTKGVMAMAEAIKNHPTPVTVVATGALTNVAVLLVLFPELKENIALISFMGGAVGGQ
jgi:inosine-uridine nucleoside N-ribohydrolase